MQIKSHADGRLQDLPNIIIRKAEEDKEFISSIDTVVFHGGIHYLSDWNLIESILDDHNEWQKLSNVLIQSVKVVISSILPRKTDKIAN